MVSHSSVNTLIDVLVHSTPKSSKSRKAQPFSTKESPIVNDEKKFKTKEGSILYQVLGSDEVYGLDKAKDQLKRNPNKWNHGIYQDKLARIQTSVLRKETEIKEKIRQWEVQFTIKNNLATPPNSDILYDKNIKRLVQHTKIIKALKRTWNLGHYIIHIILLKLGAKKYELSTFTKNIFLYVYISRDEGSNP